MSFDSLSIKLKELYDLYRNDEIILNKLIQTLNCDLPNSLINTKRIHNDRINRKIILTEAHNEFVSTFIKNNKNKYFYCLTTEIFFKYNNISYTNIKEDDIIHNILSTISQLNNITNDPNDMEQLLIPWKYKIKISIIKQLKEQSLFTSIPDSITIQNVINLFYPLIFNTKNDVKYFLTILGDNILKKNSTNIYLILSIIKPILRCLENCGAKYFSHYPLQNAFRYKYHDHVYNDCRLISVKNFRYNDQINDMISKNIMDIFVVCCYYSKRYSSADDFLIESGDEILAQYSLFLKNHTPKEIIDIFIDQKIQKSTESNISMKNMLYIWKCFLEERNIPNILFITNLKPLLKELLNYNEVEEIFYDYTSPSIPVVSNFIKFWDQCINEDINEYYLEIEEFCYLFKTWLGKCNYNITDENIINLIRHFYPDIIIENNKYILSISCSLWNKKNEIIDFLNVIKFNNDSVSKYDLYCQYTEYNKKLSKKNKFPIINKKYFDLFLNEYLKN